MLIQSGQVGQQIMKNLHNEKKKSLSSLLLNDDRKKNNKY